MDYEENTKKYYNNDVCLFHFHNLLSIYIYLKKNKKQKTKKKYTHTFTYIFISLYIFKGFYNRCTFAWRVNVIVFVNDYSFNKQMCG